MAEPILFVTDNKHKFEEAKEIVSEVGLVLEQVRPPAAWEIHTPSIKALVEHKALEAYRFWQQKLIVDHTSLHIQCAVNEYPGGCTNSFVTGLGEEQICEIFGTPERAPAFGQTTVGYADGRRVHTFRGQMNGSIVASPRGALPPGPSASQSWVQFGWNRIFAPDPGHSTFAEMGMAAKNRASMRRKALRLFLEHLGYFGVADV